MDSYQELANAIVLSAVKDYRDALKKLKRNPDYRPAKDMKAECETFFRSDWYKTLTSIDGEMLIRKLNAEAE